MEVLGDGMTIEENNAIQATVPDNYVAKSDELFLLKERVLTTVPYYWNT